MFAELILVSTMSFQVTAYRSVPEQTDDTPFTTSIGLHVRKNFCAVSRDVLGKQINYGDVLYVEIPAKPALSRYCFVADTMAKRNKHAVDFWVATLGEEKAVQVQRGYVYRLQADRGLYKSIDTKSLYTAIRSLLPTLSNLKQAL